MVSIPVKRRTQPDGRKTKQVKRNSGRVTHRRKRGWWESGDNHIKQSKVQYLKIWVLPCHSLKMRGRDRERKKRRKERERERVPTSALTSSTSLACDHTALLSYSHWTREKKGKQWARGKWSGQSGMLCRGREGERERERAKQEGEGERREVGGEGRGGSAITCSSDGNSQLDSGGWEKGVKRRKGWCTKRRGGGGITWFTSNYRTDSHLSPPPLHAHIYVQSFMQANIYAPTALTLSPYLSPQQSRCSSDVNHAPERWCHVYTCACGCVRGVGKKKETDRSAWKQGVHNVTQLTHTHRQQRHTIFASASIHGMHSTDVSTHTHRAALCFRY